ncbi:MAG: matrixin family metalloprotease [Acidobacteria bacterium]|nr:matrixin family metalloprotease [Acidobacteriota bacterium]
MYGKGHVCKTDSRGAATPGGNSPLSLILEATEGFIPLWARNSLLRWRFQDRSMALFENPNAARNEIRGLLADALLQWGDSAPVRFKEVEDAWDFEFAVQQSDSCSRNGCVLAAAFFPDAGRHQLELYPMMFEQSREEQVETMLHELGHVFGLRHFFAQITETRWRSEVFGDHSPFTIMNYGENSKLTEVDKQDLKRLYQLAWSGELSDINGTPIRFVNPHHTTL